MNRNKAIDIARGISILFVLAGHSPFIDTNLKIIICSMHVPLFFFISGMVFSYNKYPKFKDFLKAKSKGLLIPYFSLGLIVIFIVRFYKLLKQGSLLSFFDVQLWGNIKAFVVGYRLHDYYYGFWFIYALFVGIIIFYFIAKRVDKSPKRNIIYIVITIVSSAVGWLIIQRVKGFVWSLDLVPIVISFITLGYLVKLNKEKILEKILHFDIAILLMIVDGVIIYLNYRICRYTDLYACKVGNYFLYMLESIIGIWIALIISHKIEHSNILEYIGKNTYIFYMFHSQVFFRIFENEIKIFNLGKDTKFVIEMITTTLFCCAISFLINKYLPFLMGKFKTKDKKDVLNA